MSEPTPWDLYARTMFQDYGYPLWHADPEIDFKRGPREVELGSVGYVEGGKFRHLFNAMKEADDPFNTGIVPETFRPFNPPNLTIAGPEQILRQSYVASRSIRNISVTMKGNAASPFAGLVSAGGSVSFECRQETGSVLLLDGPGIGQQIRNRLAIEKYLSTHIDTWFEYATNVMGYPVQRNDLKFVFGTLKTSKWACTAFSGRYSNKKGSLKVNAAGGGDFNIQVSIEEETISRDFHNHGPPEPVANSPNTLASASTSLPDANNQCIFFHYYAVEKRRKRFWLPPKLRARAGPHQLPRGAWDNMEENSPVPATSESASDELVPEDGIFDPVAILLEYMLSKTDAQYAIASDLHVLAIFRHTGVPHDIMAGLEALKPSITVNGNNVATVAVDMKWLDGQTLSGGSSVDVENDLCAPHPSTDEAQVGKIQGQRNRGAGELRPWELYAKTMFNHFGYPLWHADPEIDVMFGRREVELGSVGYLDRGKFRHLFNARKAKDDPFNVGKVPETFEVFNPANMSIGAPQQIRQPYVASGSIGQVVVSLEGSTSSTNLVSAGGSLSFECKQNAGSILVLHQPGMGQSMHTKRDIVTYLRRHIDSIYEYATSSPPDGLGHDLKMSDIKFVSGTLKTTKWACAAFTGSYRNKKGSLTLNVPGVGGLDMDMQVSIGGQIVPDKWYNHGPSVDVTPRVLVSDDHSLPGRGDEARRDQCIFFHYFAMKKRLFRLPPGIEAAAGPHELSRGDLDGAPNSPVVATVWPAREWEFGTGEHITRDETGGRGFDPVVVLLDYILANSEAAIAVASTLDILAIFGQSSDVPDDIMTGLETIRPRIEVDENGVATVHVDTTWIDQEISTHWESATEDICSPDEVQAQKLDQTASLPSLAVSLDKMSGGVHDAPAKQGHAVVARQLRLEPRVRQRTPRVISWNPGPKYGAHALSGRPQRDRHVRAFLAQRGVLRVGTDFCYRLWNVVDTAALSRELTDPSVPWAATTSERWGNCLTNALEEDSMRNGNADGGEGSGPVMLHGYHGLFPFAQVSSSPIDGKRILSASPVEICDAFNAEEEGTTA